MSILNNLNTSDTKDVDDVLDLRAVVFSWFANLANCKLWELCKLKIQIET